MKDEFMEALISSQDLGKEAPTQEPVRQYYFIKKARQIVRELSQAAGRKLTACVITFGCQMNARDSEKLAGILSDAGFEQTQSEDADFVIYNTCTVRDNADQHFFGRLGRASHYRQTNPLMRIAVCGCMTQEKTSVDKIRGSYPYVDLIFGTHNLSRFPEYLCRVYESDMKRLLEAAGEDPSEQETKRRLPKSKTIVEIWDRAEDIVEDLPVLRKYPYKSGINIMFGCDNFCTYCIVPYVRGRERSRSARDIVREIEDLTAQGVKEVMRLGQNVNSYGRNLPEDERMSFAQLLDEVASIPGLMRVRFMTPHPKDFSDDVLEVIKMHPNIARHIHLPLQSGSTRILKKMNRHYTKEEYTDLALHIRSELPDVAITTDIIAGFPTETPEDIEDTLDVIEKVGFDNAYTFIYSVRTGTPAASMEQVPPAVVKEGFDRILAAVQESARKRTALLQGRVMEALIEEVNTQVEGYVTGRLSNNMIVHVKGDPSMIGSFVPVRLTDCRGFYYFGEINVD